MNREILSKRRVGNWRRGRRSGASCSHSHYNSIPRSNLFRYQSKYTNLEQKYSLSAQIAKEGKKQIFEVNTNAANMHIGACTNVDNIQYNVQRQN